MSATIFTFITHNQNYHHVCGVFGGLLAVITVQITVLCDKWTWRKTPPQIPPPMLPIQRGFTFQSANRRDYSGTRRCKKRVRSLSYIHFWRQTQYKQQRWMNWSEQVVPLLILKHGCGGGVSVSWRGISANQLEAFFYRRLMKIIVVPDD